MTTDESSPGDPGLGSSTVSDSESRSRSVKRSQSPDQPSTRTPSYRGERGSANALRLYAKDVASTGVDIRMSAGAEPAW
jgi:hypothetical protein